MDTKLKALRDRLLSAQRELINAAADSGAMPSDNMLRKIADIEVAIGAVETIIEDQKKS
jgi:hypothetical protein